ncbi:MAG: hypothetical protein GY723_10710 [bacterium]|nr:hypothetical protein [bacterium]MCP5069624.1 hypothetical protein [bacterium]
MNASSKSRYLYYLFYGLPIQFVIYCVLWILLSKGQAQSMMVTTLPCCIWLGRICASGKFGVVTERIPFINVSPIWNGVFWTFNPNVLDKSKNKGMFNAYFLKETVLSLFVFAFLNSYIIMEISGK